MKKYFVKEFKLNDVERLLVKGLFREFQIFHQIDENIKKDDKTVSGFYISEKIYKYLLEVSKNGLRLVEPIYRRGVERKTVGLQNSEYVRKLLKKMLKKTVVESYRGFNFDGLEEFEEDKKRSLEGLLL